MTNLAEIVPRSAVTIKGCIVSIELICSDEYGAQILFEDVVSRVTSAEGFKLYIKGNVEKGGASA